MIFKNKKALSLVEIIIALVIAVFAGIPILIMVSSSRKETATSINYLRAMELANEAIEWVNVTKFEDLDNLNNILEESIVQETDSELVPGQIIATDTEYKRWKGSNLLSKNLQYSEQYVNAYFYRTIEVTNIKGDDINNVKDNLLKKVTVTVKWSEGKKITNLNDDSSDRRHKIQLSVLVINDENLTY